MNAATAAAPARQADRITVLDVLRGVALLGVFLGNFPGLAGLNIFAPYSELNALPSAPLDRVTWEIIDAFVTDKANTIFAFLFGLGFAIQLERLEARGADFQLIYARRLAILLLVGVAHLVFVFTWDILHIYALCGFALLAMRRASDRALVVWGVILALFGRVVVEVPMTLTNAYELVGTNAMYTDMVAAQRAALSHAGDHLGLVGASVEYYWKDSVLGGVLLGWGLYVLGRFLIGAWVGRKRWLHDTGAHIAGFRMLALICTPAGLIAELASSAPLPGPASVVFSELAHMLATPLMAIGYVCLIVLLFHSRIGRIVLTPFSWTGRMALTNYIMQSFVIQFVLLGVGPGLGLAGQVGVAATTAMTFAVFAVQMLISWAWLHVFEYGPLEWLWRGANYGAAPMLMRRRAA
jgi:uncharacterized protein